MKKETKKQEPSGPLNVEFVTFSPQMYMGREHPSQVIPSAFNGSVRVRRYRVTITEIVEPNEIIADRIRKLFRETDNYHLFGPLQAAAKTAGCELDGKEFGKDAKKK